MDKETILKLRKLCLGLKVLYVEDDENISKQLHRILKKIFNKIDIEINGKNGLEKYKKYNHDIVITDMSMPIMNGIEMSHKIKMINKNQVIIITSAHSELKYMSKLIDIGVDKFVLKPIDLTSFLELLAKIAIKIFKEKKSFFLNQKMKNNVFCNMDNPIAIIEDNKLNYVNESFKKNFLKDSDGNIGNFKVGYIFRDKDMLVRENNEIIEHIISMQRVYEILHVDSKEYKTYKIDVVKIEEENKYLLNFINIDFVINNLEKSNSNNVAGLKIRRDFIDKIKNIYNDKENYYVFCFGLKNLEEYIKEYGAKQMNSINNRVAYSIKEEFSVHLEDNRVSVYKFDTNRYILISDAKVYEEITDKLKEFGKKYKYIKGKSMAFNLDFIVENINKDISQKEIIENTEAMQYMFKN